MLPFPRVKVWDWPTRVFHWLLVISVIGAWATSFREWWLVQHVWFGHAVIALLVFRIVWGWIGNGFARFSQFVTGPRTVWEYSRMRLRNLPQRKLGHNPLSAWMIVMLLLALLVITLSGAVTLAGEERAGPLAGFFTLQKGENAKSLHRWVSYALLTLATIHVLAAFIESITHNENLPWAMITGFKREEAELRDEDRTLVPNTRVQRIFLSAFTLVCLAATVLISMEYHSPVTLAAMRGEKAPGLLFYQSECASCHFGFHPGLLPSRSWETMMTGLENHFGEDASLDPDTTSMLFSYLRDNSAEHFHSEAAFKLLRSIPDSQTPQRITGTGYWKRKHEDISEEIFMRNTIRSFLNCGACHRYAEFGSYEDEHIRIPLPQTNLEGVK